MPQNSLESKKYVYPFMYVLAFIVHRILWIYIPIDTFTFFLVITTAYLSFLYLENRELKYKKEQQE